MAIITYTPYRTNTYKTNDVWRNTSTTGDAPLDQCLTIASDYASSVDYTAYITYLTSDNSYSYSSGGNWPSTIQTTSTIYPSNYYISDSITTFNYGYNIPISKKQAFRNKLKKQLRPDFTPANTDLLACNADPAEQKARELLRELITASEFRNYLRRGFITVKGKSGILYRIFGGYKHMTSYAKHDDGKYYKHEDICVVFNREMPMTDGVVMRLLLIENDEFSLRKLANVRNISPITTTKPITLVA